MACNCIATGAVPVLVAPLNHNAPRAIIDESPGENMSLDWKLPSIVEQDRCAVKSITKTHDGFKSLRAARNVLTGIELMHMIRKGQMSVTKGDKFSLTDQFYALTG